VENSVLTSRRILYLSSCIKQQNESVQLNKNFDRRSRGRPKTRWKDDVEADLRAVKITNGRTRIEDKLAWKKIVEQAKTHPGL
jgi:hypothetical protein